MRNFKKALAIRQKLWYTLSAWQKVIVVMTPEVAEIRLLVGRQGIPDEQIQHDWMRYRI